MREAGVREMGAETPLPRLEVAELRHVRLPMVVPFETSMGRLNERDAFLIRLRADGLEGWGEAAAWRDPSFSYETVETCFYAAERYLLPLLFSAAQPAARGIDSLLTPVRGYPMAKAALETAAADLAARAQGISLSRWLGGSSAEVIVGISLGIEASHEALLGRIEQAVAKNYRRAKIKIRPGWDLAVVEAIRRRWPDLPISVDANSAYTLADRELFKALDAHGLVTIEQPLRHDDLVDHADLQSGLVTPVCLDESLASLADLEAAIRLKSCRMVNLKPGRVGGLRQSLAVHDLCHDQGLALFCGGMLETGIGRAANLAIASLKHFRIASDLSESARYFARDLVDPPFRLTERGTLAVPAGPGIGVTIDEGELERRTVTCHSFTRSELAGAQA